MNLEDNKNIGESVMQNSELYQAVKQDKKQQIQRLLSASNRDLKTSINAKHGPYGHTLLYEACLNGNQDIVRYLLSLGNIDVNAIDELHRETALHAAASGGYNDIVQLLLKRDVSFLIDRYVCANIFN